MRGLPEFVYRAKAHPGQYDGPEKDRYMGCCPACDDIEMIREALAIAFEYMDAAITDGISVKDIRIHLVACMSRIEALGKEHESSENGGMKWKKLSD